MMFWVIAGAMTAIVVAVLLTPLLRRRGEVPTRRAYDLAVYRDQLAEIDRDLERGVVDKSQAEAARREVERRLLAAGADDSAASAMKGTVGAPGRTLAAALAVLVPGAALGLYFWLGDPGVPSQPFAERPGVETGTADLASLADNLARRLAESPDEPRDWVLLGRTYAELGRYAEAASATREAIARGADGPESRTFLAEMLVGANAGVVVPEARQLFAQVLEQDPGNPYALYYAGLALAQDGHLRRAYDLWLALARGAPPQSPWLPVLKQQIERIAAELDIEPPEITVGAAPGGAPGAGGPSAADMEAAAAMSPEERMAFIRSMVEGLAERLEAVPDDLQGWLRLARAYQVLGEVEKAATALDRADGLTADLAADAPERAAIEAARRALQQAPN